MVTAVKTKPKQITKNSKHIILFLILTLYLGTLVIYPKIVSSGIKNGINCCLDILIPSMFPFMVAASIISLSGTSEKSNFVFKKASKLLFYLPPCTIPAIIMSLIGGYPVGAYCVKSLYKSGNINEEQLNRMMCFCVNFGPAFIISALGQMLLNNLRLGIILFFIQVVSTVVIGIILGIAARIKKTDFYSKKISLQKKSFSFSQILIGACNDTCKALLGMCALITLFFGIISIINELGLINYISYLLLKINVPNYISNATLLSILEVTQSCMESSKNNFIPHYMYSWILGFGGVCAHTQIIAQLSDCPFKYAKFLVMRIINGLLTAALTALIIKDPEKTLQTFAPLTINQATEISKASPTHTGSIALLIFCIFFTFSVNSFTNVKMISNYNKKASAKTAQTPNF